MAGRQCMTGHQARKAHLDINGNKRASAWQPVTYCLFGRCFSYLLPRNNVTTHLAGCTTHVSYLMALWVRGPSCCTTGIMVATGLWLIRASGGSSCLQAHTVVGRVQIHGGWCTEGFSVLLDVGQRPPTDPCCHEFVLYSCCLGVHF